MTDFTKPETRGIWSEAGLRVLQERYLQKDADGNVCETPEEMCWRVACAIAQAEEKWGCNLSEVQKLAEEFYQVMIEHQFLPNSPTLMNAGTNGGLQYSACYVLPVPDSIVGIFDAVKNAALIHKSGGGTGFSFSRLRPTGSRVRSSSGIASGPVSFMKVFDAATEQIKQGGRRRGANMGILRVDHPDILEFISCKIDGGITNFNISVAVTGKFMQALAESSEYELVAPHTGEVVGQLQAHEVFDRITKVSWQTGDPGLFFIDRCNQGPANPTPGLAKVEATNPCGEQPLYPNEACNLGSINLAGVVRIPEGGWPVENPKEAIDWDELERIVRLTVRFLDDVIEVNPYPLPEIAEMVYGNRRIGLGVMGWADMLFELGIPYDSEKALSLVKEVMGFINRVGHEESVRLAEERGAFPNFPQSIYANSEPLRNATVTTIAPTGSLSIIAGCSSGIEPAFALAFRHIAKERCLQLVNPVFEQVARKQGFYTEDLMLEVERTGRVQGLPSVPEDVQRVFVTAHEIAPSWHVRMQAAFQKHTDNAVSKTVNLPNSTTPEDVAQVFLQAYEEGCLGVTVFRDGCKKEQVLHAGIAEVPKMEGPAMKPRPRVLPGKTYRQETPLGTAFITVTDDPETGQPFEVFVQLGKAGSDTMAVAEGIGRLISLALRLLSPLSPYDRVVEIIGQLSGIGGARRVGFGLNSVASLPDAIAQVLAEHIGLEGNKEATTIVFSDDDLPRGELCPICGMATLVREEGCNKCYNCYFSDCS